MHKIVKNTLKIAAIPAVAVIALAGCASGDKADHGAMNHDHAQMQMDQSQSTGQAKVELTDPWVKSATSGKATAAFAKIKNTDSKSVKLVGATFNDSGMVMIHDTVKAADGSTKMVMVDGGLEIKPGETLELKPGGKHVMLMDLKKDLKAGDTATITLKFDNGTTVKQDFKIRDFNGAQENYNGNN